MQQVKKSHNQIPIFWKKKEEKAVDEQFHPHIIKKTFVAWRSVLLKLLQVTNQAVMSKSFNCTPSLQDSIFGVLLLHYFLI